MKRIALVSIACIVVTGVLTTTATAAEMVVGKDPADDWSYAGIPNENVVGHALAQEIVQARIGMANPKTVNFVIVLDSFPPTGGVPEVTRYTWEMAVGTRGIRLDGKFTNYTGEGGTCDPFGGCPPPRDMGAAPFFVYSQCDQRAPTVCTEEGIVHATFDLDDATITIPVPLKMLGAKPGSTILGSYSFFGGIMAMPAAYGSLRAGPSDQLQPNRPYVIPGG